MSAGWRGACSVAVDGRVRQLKSCARLVEGSRHRAETFVRQVEGYVRWVEGFVLRMEGYIGVEFKGTVCAMVVGVCA